MSGTPPPIREPDSSAGDHPGQRALEPARDLLDPPHESRQLLHLRGERLDLRGCQRPEPLLERAPVLAAEGQAHPEPGPTPLQELRQRPRRRALADVGPPPGPAVAEPALDLGHQLARGPAAGAGPLLELPPEGLPLDGAE